MSKQTDLINVPDAITVSGSNVGINDTAPSSLLQLTQTSDDASGGLQIRNTADSNSIYIYQDGTETNFDSGSSGAQAFKTANNDRLNISQGGFIGINQSDPTARLHVNVGSNTNNVQSVLIEGSNTGTSTGPDITLYRNSVSPADSDNLGAIHFYGNNSAAEQIHYALMFAEVNDVSDGSEDASIVWSTMDGGTLDEAMRIDTNRKLLVGKSASNLNNVGVELEGTGRVNTTVNSTTPVLINRTGTEGALVSFRYGNVARGFAHYYAHGFQIQGESGHSGISFAGNAWIPLDDGNRINNLIDLGHTSYRFDDVYATNGTINTSDFNEKQDIESLTPTEMLVGKRISALFKTFRWKDSVAEKGDNARTHTGVIAQDVQAAFTAEGLDAGDYSLFISSTWWEHLVDVPAAEASEEDGTPAKDAYTRTDNYDTEAEAPEGATEKTRLGIRYLELLAFVAAYNEQRSASIEARLTALEA